MEEVQICVKLEYGAYEKLQNICDAQGKSPSEVIEILIHAEAPQDEIK